MYYQEHMGSFGRLALEKRSLDHGVRGVQGKS